jgi:hypothetical protein
VQARWGNERCRGARADAQAHIHTKRLQDVACDDGNIVCCHQRVRKPQIGAGLRIEGKAAENFWQAVRGTGIGAGLGHESRRVARVTGGVDFSPLSAAVVSAFPLRCPQRLGHVWSSIMRPAPPARSNARVV